MRVIYIHQYFKLPNESGGTRSYDLSTEFARSGYKVDIVTTTSDRSYISSKRWTSVNREGISVHYVYLPYSNEFSYAKRILIFLQFLWFSTFKVLALKADLLLATSTPLTIAVPALIKKWFHGTPFVFETRDVWPEAVIAIGAIENKWIQKLLYWFEKLIYKQASAIVPLSTDMEKSITSRYPELKAKPIEVIENISSLDRFQSYSSTISILPNYIGKEPKFSVLYAGTFGMVNGIAYVIRLAEKVLKVDTNIVFILIGEGAEKTAITEMAIEKGVLNENVFILESVAKEDLPQLYHEVDMGSSFVIPVRELWANSANKFFDTLAAGKPILINHEGWQKEIIEGDNLGYVLPSVLSDEAVGDFVAYTRDVQLHQLQCLNALAKAKMSYSLQEASRKYLELFKKVI